MAAIMISVAGINCENLSCNKRGVHIWGEGISHSFKVIKIESYEDTLNNLQLRRTKPQQDLVEPFNYLIGLRVKHIDMQRNKCFVSVTGWLPTGEKTLVMWRDVA